MQQPALLIMVKNPVAGRTKTRLAQDVGHEKALEMYRVLMRHTRDQAAGLKGVTRYLHYSERVDVADDWPNDDFIKLVQMGPGLGERMAAAFDRAFARDHDRVVIIGSDCPGVTTELLNNAFAALADHEVVIGPALDGGYYLLGMRHPHPELFAGMEWSTAEVLEQTLARTRERGLTVKQLAALSDVDHLEDWLGYGWPL
ncbi:TIGR04282 family arsenosugar biosynthesis glycosyltransferase [Lewinella sp. JB7]|uniref:TIGR04282 family arsenosugar biosynthesis glycosyltransferase n=1 Tax=Lewinella sp. JB7 TaxID=2962887 RepID=UPI0020C96011|nr:TIGR04282 family arsenosugar biosynthesis glycosyltransferase [Lewinella sp. JB7]MCP9236380.1 TIGR04282 family arsenosugar biosynthesis glycosyltransferase [Lewinella sp. JB7]